MNNTEGQNQKEKTYNNKFLAVSIIISVIILLVCIFTFAYAKYVSTVQGNATAQVAKMICEMSAVTSEKSSTIINPYCTVTVKNTKTEGEGANQTTKRTETGVQYTLEVTPKDGRVLPEHYWVRVQGQTETILARSTDTLDAQNNVIARTASFPAQYFGNTQDETAVYKVIFINTGDETDPLNSSEPLERTIDIQLVAVQRH